MPVTCPLAIRGLTAAEFDKIDFRVMGQAFASQNELGRLCEEGIYQRDLQARLLADGFEEVQVEVPVTVSHAGFSKVYFLDLVANQAVYELKTAAALSKEHEAQLLNYLFLLGLPRGKLINFRPAKVEGSLHAASVTPEERRQVKVDLARWQDVTPGCATLKQTMLGLLADWGGYLSTALYEEALTDLLGGESRVMERLPLRRKGVYLGDQQFRLHSPDMAFRVTAVTWEPEALGTNLRQLLSLSELRGLQWINLNHANVQFVTLTR